MAISYKRPIAAEGWAPVMATAELSEMITVIGELSHTALNKPVMPEWVKVESPITAIAGNNPASAAPFAIGMDAPISIKVSMLS